MERGSALVRLAEQAAALAVREPDVAALREVTDTTLPLWRAVLERIELLHVRASWTTPTRPANQLGDVAPACCWPPALALRDPSVTLPVPWTETAVAAVAETAIGPVEIHCLHVPNAANGWVKAHTLQAVRAGLQAAPSMGRVVCGDLQHPGASSRAAGNSPSREARAGACGRSADPRWDEAELGVVPGLRDLGYRDAYRSLHGYGSREPSWTWQRISGHDGGWRLDHLFSSPELKPTTSVYHHSWRDEGLSDHSALEADLVRRSNHPAPACMDLQGIRRAAKGRPRA